MTRSIIIGAALACACLAVTLSVTGQSDPAPATQADVKLELTTQRDRISYAYGLYLGATMKQTMAQFEALGAEFDKRLATKGAQDAMSGTGLLMTNQQAEAVLQAFQVEMSKRKQALAAHNLAAANEFLAANRQSPGVQTTASGLQYKVVVAGTGATPQATDTVTVHYVGKLSDGTVFDSSRAKGRPSSFQVGGVIRGWTEALKMMKVGAKWQLFIPPNLAYGEQGRPTIPPNSMLQFEVELLEIQSPDG